MKMLMRKAGDDKPVEVSIGKDKLALKRGSAAAVKLGGAANGSAKVRVMPADLLRVLPTLLALDTVGSMIWKLDPDGLLSVEVETRAARVEVFIQTLEDGRDGNVRNRALLERVQALPKEVAATDAPEPALMTVAA